MFCRNWRSLGGLCVFTTLLWGAPAYAQRPDYPPTKTTDVVDDLHGVKVPDPYRWLENGDDPAVQQWTEAQNALTRKCLDRFTEPRLKLARRIEELLTPNIGSPPAVFGERYFFTKREGLQNHAVLYVRDGAGDAPPRVVIDPNTFSADGTVALDWWTPSPDGSLIVYGKSASGSEKSTLYLRDVATAADLALVIPNTRFAAIAWDVDNQGFTYSRYPEPGSVPPGDENYFRSIYYHKFGTDWKADAKIFGAGRPKEESIDVSNSGDNRYQFLTTTLDWARNDFYIRKMGTAEFHPIAVGLAGNFGGDVLGDLLYLNSNYQAPRGRIVAVNLEQPAEAGWKVVVPEAEGVINEFAVAGGKLIVNRMENAFSSLTIHSPDGKLLKTIELPTLGSVGGLSGRPDRDELFFSFQSFAYPPVVYRCDLTSFELTAIDRLEVDVDLERYETKQLWCHSKDGTRVPLFVTHKKGLQLDGNNPAILGGYGGFNISALPGFNRTGMPWLDAGGVLASANIRGGGEFGQDWHKAGRLDKKQNCFDDFIAAAEKLVADGYTRPQRLGIRGGSNGGLLMGAMMVQRPDLFGAICCEVPLLDMLRYQRFEIARLWIPEYGSADDADQFKFLFAYSPYQNVRQGVKYPAIFLRTAASDTRVDPMHARKMAAALQAATASARPILLWVQTKAGHGSGKPLRKSIEDQVDVMTFFMWQLGLLDEADKPGPTEDVAAR